MVNFESIECVQSLFTPKKLNTNTSLHDIHHLEFNVHHKKQ